MYPEPAGFSTATLAPARGAYDEVFRDFILPYADAVASEDPDATVLAFLEATYASGAGLAGWDLEALERRHRPLERR